MKTYVIYNSEDDMYLRLNHRGEWIWHIKILNAVWWYNDRGVFDEEYLQVNFSLQHKTQLEKDTIHDFILKSDCVDSVLIVPTDKNNIPLFCTSFRLSYYIKELSGY